MSSIHWRRHWEFVLQTAPGSEAAICYSSRTWQRLLRKVRCCFFKIDRSVFTSGSSHFVRYSSISKSVSGLWDLPISVKRPAFRAFTQLAIVDGATFNRRPASGNDRWSSVINFTASIRNSLKYLPLGILYIQTPLSLYFTWLRCPLNLYYITLSSRITNP